MAVYSSRMKSLDRDAKVIAMLSLNNYGIFQRFFMNNSKFNEICLNIILINPPLSKLGRKQGCTDRTGFFYIRLCIPYVTRFISFIQTLRISEQI